MKVLVMNVGSSSFKFKLFDMETESVLAQGFAEKIGMKDSFFSYSNYLSKKRELEEEIKDIAASC